jgi:hypothetical protein
MSDSGDGSTHPYDVATSAFADLAERAGEYAEIWRRAIARNAAGEYKPEDALVDVQALWGLSVRDLARTSSALLEVLAPHVPTDAFSGGTSSERAPTTD